MDDPSEMIATTRVHRSLMRPDRDHMLGAERSLVVSIGALAFIFGWIMISVPTVIAAILLVLIGIPVVRAMAKRDPIFSRVLIRRLSQQHEYLASPHTTGHVPDIPPQQRT